MFSFARVIKERRQKAGMTQRDLANKLGIDPTYISKIENLALQYPPSVALIRQMAEVLNLDADDLCLTAGQVDWKRLRALAWHQPDIGRELQAILDRLQRQPRPEYLKELV